MPEITGTLNANGKKFAIVVGRFNQAITSKLLEGAVDCIARHGGKKEDITTVWVPGSFEIPQTVKKCLESKKWDSVIALGAVIKGDTPHFDHVSNSVTSGLAQLSLQSSIPVVYGVLTTETVEQAMDRAGVKSGNKGWDAALTALDMISVLEQL